MDWSRCGRDEAAEGIYRILSARDGARRKGALGPGARTQQVRQVRLGEKDPVNLTSKTVKGKQQETFRGPKRMCFTAYL